MLLFAQVRKYHSFKIIIIIMFTSLKKNKQRLFQVPYTFQQQKQLNQQLALYQNYQNMINDIQLIPLSQIKQRLKQNVADDYQPGQYEVLLKKLTYKRWLNYYIRQSIAKKLKMNITPYFISFFQINEDISMRRILTGQLDNDTFAKELTNFQQLLFSQRKFILAKSSSEAIQIVKSALKFKLDEFPLTQYDKFVKNAKVFWSNCTTSNLQITTPIYPAIKSIASILQKSLRLSMLNMQLAPNQQILKEIIVRCSLIIEATQNLYEAFMVTRSLSSKTHQLVKHFLLQQIFYVAKLSLLTLFYILKEMKDLYEEIQVNPRLSNSDTPQIYLKARQRTFFTFSKPFLITQTFQIYFSFADFIFPYGTKNDKKYLEKQLATVKYIKNLKLKQKDEYYARTMFFENVITKDRTHNEILRQAVNNKLSVLLKQFKMLQTAYLKSYRQKQQQTRSLRQTYHSIFRKYYDKLTVQQSNQLAKMQFFQVDTVRNDLMQVDYDILSQYAFQKHLGVQYIEALYEMRQISDLKKQELMRGGESFDDVMNQFQLPKSHARLVKRNQYHQFTPQQKKNMMIAYAKQYIQNLRHNQQTVTQKITTLAKQKMSNVYIQYLNLTLTFEEMKYQYDKQLRQTNENFLTFDDLLQMRFDLNSMNIYQFGFFLFKNIINQKKLIQPYGPYPLIAKQKEVIRFLQMWQDKYSIPLSFFFAIQILCYATENTLFFSEIVMNYMDKYYQSLRATITLQKIQTPLNIGYYPLFYFFQKVDRIQVVKLALKETINTIKQNQNNFDQMLEQDQKPKKRVKLDFKKTDEIQIKPQQINVMQNVIQIPVLDQRIQRAVQIRQVIREVEVVREVPVEVIREVEVVREVPVEVIREVIREVPVEVVREVIREVPVEVIKQVIVPKEVIKQVIRQSPFKRGFKQVDQPISVLSRKLNQEDLDKASQQTLIKKRKKRIPTKLKTADQVHKEVDDLFQSLQKIKQDPNKGLYFELVKGKHQSRVLPNKFHEHEKKRFEEYLERKKAQIMYDIHYFKIKNMRSYEFFARRKQLLFDQNVYYDRIVQRLKASLQNAQQHYAKKGVAYNMKQTWLIEIESLKKQLEEFQSKKKAIQSHQNAIQAQIIDLPLQQYEKERFNNLKKQRSEIEKLMNQSTETESKKWYSWYRDTVPKFMKDDFETISTSIDPQRLKQIRTLFLSVSEIIRNTEDQKTQLLSSMIKVIFILRELLNENLGERVLGRINQAINLITEAYKYCEDLDGSIEKSKQYLSQMNVE